MQNSIKIAIGEHYSNEYFFLSCIFNVDLHSSMRFQYYFLSMFDSDSHVYKHPDNSKQMKNN